MKRIILSFGVVLLMLSFQQALLAQTSVTCSVFSQVGTNMTTTISVGVTPTNLADDVSLELHCLRGAGGAVFSLSGSNIATIRTSASLPIIGAELSSSPTNMTLDARLGTMVLASNAFTVTCTNMIGFVQAIAIAQQRIAGYVTPEPNSPITVELISSNTEYQVTFENIYDENVLKGDFSARIWINATNGMVLRGESGP